MFAGSGRTRSSLALRKVDLTPVRRRDRFSPRALSVAKSAAPVIPAKGTTVRGARGQTGNIIRVRSSDLLRPEGKVFAVSLISQCPTARMVGTSRVFHAVTACHVPCALSSFPLTGCIPFAILKKTKLMLF